jgi:hypothetical protein
MVAHLNNHPKAFFRGITRVVDLFGSTSRVCQLKREMPSSTDDALRRDWQKIGSDFRYAVTKTARSIQNEPEKK